MGMFSGECPFVGKTLSLFPVFTPYIKPLYALKYQTKYSILKFVLIKTERFLERGYINHNEKKCVRSAIDWYVFHSLQSLPTDLSFTTQEIRMPQ